MISKKRYWGLALPFWICPNEHVTVIGGREELAERAIGGLQGLESPHRPWVDAVKITCDECGETAERIPDVGNPWLDAGIVPFSTTGYNSDRDHWAKWFPADFITESFPGQFRNWFYSMLAMSTVLEDTNPFDVVLGYALVRDQQGREMHKSWGNAIAFDDAADRAGADTMRWLFVQHNPSANINFGWQSLDEVKRGLLTLWNTYSFFITYAKIDGWQPGKSEVPVGERPLLDRWIIARLNRLILDVRGGLDRYDAMGPARAINAFVEELSTWYVRRSRRRFWKSESDADKDAAYATLYACLTELSRLMAPFMPFLSEALYGNLVASVAPDAPRSVHLTDYPEANLAHLDEELLGAMETAQRVVALGRAARDRVNVKVRQPLARMFVKVPDDESQADVSSLRDLILDELNVKELGFAGNEDEFVTYTIRPNLPALGPRFGRRLPEVRNALGALDPAVVAGAVGRGEAIELPLNGQTEVLGPEDVLVSAQEREGYAAMGQDGVLVALDTELTRDLILEGYAREVVRRVNDWRKLANFEIDDRIEIAYDASHELDVAIERFREYIAQETLAVRLERAELQGQPNVFEAEFGDQRLAAQLRRVR